MIIKFWSDNNANVKSERTEEVEVDDEQWVGATEEQRQAMVREWALETLEYGYEEIEVSE